MILKINYHNKEIVLFSEENDSEKTKKIVEDLQQIINDKNETLQVKMLILDNIKKQIENNKEPDFFLEDVYLVGGAVRDLIMNKNKIYNDEIKDKDYVLINYSEEKMFELGFKKVGVGNNFPIFLDDKGVEFALARKERKNNNKSENEYKNFDFETKNVSLEEDLSRRDLTINSIASKVLLNLTSPLELKENKKFDTADIIIDPFNGISDIRNKVLKHTTKAFEEDPIRILRTCRFAARYGFNINEETKEFIKKMIKDGMLDKEKLTQERIFSEIKKGLSEKNGHIMFKELKECNALEKILPEVDVLFGIPQTEKYHPEIDTGIHTMMVLEQACKMNLSLKARIGALFHDLGKGVTPKEILPRHLNHEENGIPIVENVCNRLKMPSEYKNFAKIVCGEHLNVHNAFSLTPNKILKMFKMFNKEEDWNDFVLSCEADARGRKGFENIEYNQSKYLIELYKNFKLDSKIKEDIREKTTKLKELKKDNVIPNVVLSIKIHGLKKHMSKLKNKYIKELDNKKNKMKNK